MSKINNISLGCCKQECGDWKAEICEMYVVNDKERVGLLICGGNECVFIDHCGRMTYSPKEYFEGSFKLIRKVTGEVSIKVE